MANLLERGPPVKLRRTALAAVVFLWNCHVEDPAGDSIARPSSQATQSEADAGGSRPGESEGSTVDHSVASAGHCADAGISSAADGDLRFGVESLGEALDSAYTAAKDVCDQRLSPHCAEFILSFGSDGCVVEFTTTEGWGSLSPGYAECMVEQLAEHCDPCAADWTIREYESCTIL
jgi:hypothetical protein